MQILPFVGFWVKEMWSDFGDPERKICVAQGDEVREVKPKYIWGDLKVRITSIKNFQDNAMQRKEESEILTQLVPTLMQFGAMDANGLKILAKQYFKRRSVEDIDEILKTKSSSAAIQQAKTENMIILWGGSQDMPQQDDDHAAHLKTHTPYREACEALQEGSRPLEGAIATMKQHEAMHTYMMGGAEGGQPQGQPQQQMQPQGAPQGMPTPGEGMGDVLGGQMGDMGNAPAPDTGRPPLIEGMA
jgi:hypothetical protein